MAADGVRGARGVVFDSVVVDGEEDVGYALFGEAGGGELGSAHGLVGDFEEADRAGGHECDVGFGEAGELFAGEVSVEEGEFSNFRWGEEGVLCPEVYCLGDVSGDELVCLAMDIRTLSSSHWEESASVYMSWRFTAED